MILRRKRMKNTPEFKVPPHFQWCEHQQIGT